MFLENKYVHLNYLYPCITLNIIKSVTKGEKNKEFRENKETVAIVTVNTWYENFTFYYLSDP